MPHQIICMWSGPRNISTAMMRSFGNRTDCHVWDEPFFAPWLAATGIDHPARDETLALCENDPVKVAHQTLLAPPGGAPYYFQKHMPHHMMNTFPLTWTHKCRHFFLLRRPDAVIASYIKARADFKANDIGFWPQLRMYDWLITQGHDIPIVESDDIRSNPTAILSKLCAALEMPFDRAMLKWRAGKRPTDGPWAPWWYKSVTASTGFTPPVIGKPQIPRKYIPLVEACWPAYVYLHDKRLLP